MTSKTLLLLVVFSGLVAVGLIGYGDFRETFRQLVNFPVTHLFAALALALLNYFLRFVRWTYYLNVVEINIPLAPSALVFLSGLAMSITPGKMGEVLKCYLLRDRTGAETRPVAEEATVTAELMGSQVVRVNDVGVAGLHRLLDSLPVLKQANVIVVVAGMEAAIAGAVAGLVSAPVVTVPTSVGYGASFDGLAALLGMMNSCAPGIAVVNIDNGFGGGYLAAQINSKISPQSSETARPDGD